MSSVRCVAPWALGVPALGRVVLPGEVVEVTDEQWAGMAYQSGVWESVAAPEGWTEPETPPTAADAAQTNTAPEAAGSETTAADATTDPAPAEVETDKEGAEDGPAV